MSYINKQPYKKKLKAAVVSIWHRKQNSNKTLLIQSHQIEHIKYQLWAQKNQVKHILKIQRICSFKCVCEKATAQVPYKYNSLSLEAKKKMT